MTIRHATPHVRRTMRHTGRHPPPGTTTRRPRVRTLAQLFEAHDRVSCSARAGVFQMVKRQRQDQGANPKPTSRRMQHRQMRRRLPGPFEVVTRGHDWINWKTVGMYFPETDLVGVTRPDRDWLPVPNTPQQRGWHDQVLHRQHVSLSAFEWACGSSSKDPSWCIVTRADPRISIAHLCGAAPLRSWMDPQPDAFDEFLLQAMTGGDMQSTSGP